MSPKNVEAEDELPVLIEVEQDDEFLEPDLTPSVEVDSPADADDPVGGSENETDDSKGESVEDDAANEAAVSEYVKVLYLGAADAVSFGPYKFRPGKPVFVPMHIAEELLTFPHEQFEVKE